MYISISAQTLGNNFSQSVGDFVQYLEKENEGVIIEEQEHFFNQYGDEYSAKEVIKDIDNNTAKLKKHEPKFYSITVSPSQRELKQLQNSSNDLKHYTRELMKDYVTAFNREINGKPITISDIKYYAKIEHTRSFKGTDTQVKENQPYATQILKLKQDIRKIESGTLEGNIKKNRQTIKKLERTAPHQQNGKRIVQGMQKDGNQSHIHIIVSRKDASNSVSLSPGSKYKASDVAINGKLVKRGFDRDSFFAKAEQTFDRTFAYKRNYAESYQARKGFIKNPKLYFSSLLGLPTHERAIAFKILGKAGVPLACIPTNQVQLALKTIKTLKHGIDIAIKSGSIGI
ncbi:MAG: MobB family relaxase [Algibacter sp.]|uniref:MobB family relaxase n=1 Tax=Algibacter sp. TaxID=1872428 RepID=UPI0026254D8C|nr:MobB family relaxase [Algibacter sp.]MDG1729911.1 MobB family relaxase [Algibacter sp.]MDG2178502.1 MobB family relaxase [Algibacter sp.]